MGKDKIKKYVVISGFNVSDNNRGTAALGYGAIEFCQEYGYLYDGQELLNIKFIKKFWKKQYRDKTENHKSCNKVWKHHTIHVFVFEQFLLNKFKFTIPFTKFGRLICNIETVVCINGGDGFSDIYGTRIFYNRLPETKMAMSYGIPVIQLPQTLGPFKEKKNYCLAKKILRYSKDVYVRDEKFTQELEKLGIKYVLTKDLSAYMQPEPWDIDIKPNSIGINVSGLAYSNRFHTLSGQFDAYPELINRLICHFRDKGHTIYLIPHSYNYGCPELNNDDIVACKAAYEKLQDKNNVVLIDKDLISPQIKYVISKMAFFIGTRMHANFAAIYTKVPVFGLAYSYKFAGAFNANGLDGEKQTVMINNIKKKEIGDIVNKVELMYLKLTQ